MTQPAMPLDKITVTSGFFGCRYKIKDEDTSHSALVAYFAKKAQGLINEYRAGRDQSYKPLVDKTCRLHSNIVAVFNEIESKSKEAKLYPIVHLIAKVYQFIAYKLLGLTNPASIPALRALSKTLIDDLNTSIAIKKRASNPFEDDSIKKTKNNLEQLVFAKLKTAYGNNTPGSEIPVKLQEIQDAISSAILSFFQKPNEANEESRELINRLHTVYQWTPLC